MKRARTILILLALVGGSRVAAAAEPPEVTVLDDGEKIARDPARPLPPSPWTGAIDLFALKGETLALQVVAEPRGAPIDRLRVTLGPLVAADGSALDAKVDLFAERFLEIKRPSGGAGEGSLAFTAKSAPAPGAFVGFFSDPLVPEEASSAPADERAAIWVDARVPENARAGTYSGSLVVYAGGAALATRPVSVRVIDRAMPYAAARTMVYYDPATLKKRMGDLRAEVPLRQLLHAHGVSAIREVTSAGEMALDDAALDGSLFTREKGYDGPGAGAGEGVFAIGAYGALGDPDVAKRAAVEEIVAHLRARGVFERTESFVYAIDERCASPRGARWMELLRARPRLRGVRVGVTCDDPPARQPVDLVMTTTARFDPREAGPVIADGKSVWVYNGIRPHAGPMMLDVPATDLRANGWIAARYAIARWFYWESTFWLDANRGGQGGADGFDPFVTAETFHNADGDHANGDGILVYPGTQRPRGMRDDGRATVYPSVRLKNLRRGIEDAGYIALAREVNAEAANAVVARVVPRALGRAGDRVAWPERGAEWLAARRELARVIESPRRPASHGCASGGAADASYVSPFLLALAIAVARRRGFSRT